MKQLRSAASLAIVANVLAGKFDISIKFTTDEAYCGVSESGKYEIGFLTQLIHLSVIFC